MAYIQHMNHTNANGAVYCCLRNRLVTLNQLQILNYCSSCKMHNGNEEGNNVVCVWDDHREVNNPHVVVDPFLEYQMMQRNHLEISLQKKSM
jgi:hypothetical protein